MAEIKSRRTKEFRKQFDKLPSHIKRIAQRKFELFMQNPYHPSFRRKVIQSTRDWLEPHHEFTITPNYRATCVVQGNEYIWVFIGTHDEFDIQY